MKKLIGITLALLMTLGLSTAVLADGPTTVVVDWDDGSGGYASGWVGTTVTAGDDVTTTFQSLGSGIRGHFEATDQNDNPYPSYNVDTFSTRIDAEVLGGVIEFQTDRTDSAGMYGSAGQQSYNFVGSDGWGAMATNSWTNYASEKDCCYNSPRTVNGHHFEVSGATVYTIDKYIRAGDGDWAEVLVTGAGLAQLDCMNSVMSGSGVQLGRGCGCYTDADFHAVGSGSFLAQTQGGNYAEIYATGTSAYGSGASVGIIASWVAGGCDISDYSMYAN